MNQIDLQNNNKKILKIGLILDSNYSSIYDYSLCQWAEKNEYINISHLIIQNIITKKNFFIKLLKYINPINIKLTFKILFWRVIIFYERIKLQRTIHNNHFNRFDLSNIIKNKILINPIIIKNRYTFSDSEIEQIQYEKFDLLIRCGSGILSGKILKASKFGIISFHHGDNRINRGGPPCFWEVFNKQSKTGFVIQKLNNILDGGEVLKRGFFPTQPYFLLNQAHMYTRSIYFMKELLIDIAKSQQINIETKIYPYYNKLLKLPTFSQQLYYFYIQFNNFISNFFKKKFFTVKDKWHVAFKKSSWNSLIMDKSIVIQNPHNHFFADPFIVDFNKQSFCFMEDYNFETLKGSICSYELKENQYFKVGTVLEEDFHLSFPYIFKFKSDYYMLPESSKNNDLRIYKSTSFPIKWKLEKIIFQNISCAESMIFQHNDKWWLFTNIDRTNYGDHSSELFIFFADNPISDQWISHPKNPIIQNPDLARNGGLLYNDNSIYRVNQKFEFNQYGKNFSINEIIILNTKDYYEKKIFTVEPNFFNNIKATHHIHSNNKYTVFDFLN